MKKLIVQYGSTQRVRVISASRALISVVALDDDKEAYMLMGHGMDKDELPEVGDTGTITFTRHNGPTKGYWHFKADEK